jgi:hypothetical protein
VTSCHDLPLLCIWFAWSSIVCMFWISAALSASAASVWPVIAPLFVLTVCVRSFNDCCHATAAAALLNARVVALSTPFNAFCASFKLSEASRNRDCAVASK